MRRTSSIPPDNCPDCGGAFVPVSLLARGPEGLAGTALEAPVKYYVDADGEHGMSGESAVPRGTVRALLCSDCHRLYLYGVPTSLEGPKRVNPQAPSQRGIDEPLLLARDSTDGFDYFRVDQEGMVTIVEMLTERIKVLDDRVHQQISDELSRAVELCHARVVLDLSFFVPWYHSSGFVATVIRFKRRWLEKFAGDARPTGETEDKTTATPSRSSAQPSVRQLSFPVQRDRAGALQTLNTAPEGTTEIIMCNVHKTLYDVLKVTRLCRN